MANAMENKESEKEAFIHPDGGYGWIVVVAIIFINVTVLPLMQCFGIIFAGEFVSMDINAAQSSFLLHLHSSIFCSFAFFCSPLLKTYSYRNVALFGASLMSLGIFLTSFANSYSTLLLSVSIVGFGQSILMPATYLAINSYFKNKLTLATSFSVTGAGLSLIFMPKICDILLGHIGRKSTVLTLSALASLSLIFCFLLKPVQKQAEKTVVCDLQKENIVIKEEVNEKLLNQSNGVYKPTTVPAKKKTVFSQIYNLFDLQLLKQRPYVLVVIGLGISFASELNVILMMQFLLPELSDFSRSDVALVTSVQSVFDIAGRLVIPLLSTFFNASPKVMYSGSLLVASAARLVLAVWCKSYTAVFITISIIGLTKGSRAVFQSVIIPKLVPLEKIPAATGLNMLFTGAVSLIAGPVIGFIHDTTKSYVYALHAASIISTFCVLLWLMEFLCAKKKVATVDGC